MSEVEHEVLKFVELHRDLLDQERNAEAEETALLLQGIELVQLQKRGIAITRLAVSSSRTALYGRTVVKLVYTKGPSPEEKNAERPLPATKIRTGDIVEFSSVISGKKSPLASGVVTQLSSTRITVAFDEPLEAHLSGQNLALTKTANEVTYKRSVKVLADLAAYAGNGSSKRVARSAQCHADPIIRKLFTLAKPELDSDRPLALMHSESSSSNEVAMKWYNGTLNDSQRSAVLACMSQEPVSIIHGPPGTGKTTTVVELIYQLAKRRQKIIAAAPSNIAVDNLVERLALAGVKVVRIGHPARIIPSAQHCSLDAMVDISDEADLCRDVRREMDSVMLKLAKKHIKFEERRALFGEFKTLRRELRKRESDAVVRVLADAEVIVGTLSSINYGGPVGSLPLDHFNVAVVDEAGQAIEAACWSALLYAPKCILAGDHLQLPPTLSSETAAKRGLNITLLERAVKLNTSSIHLLDTQYRMNQLIMQWSSDVFYKSRLLAAPEVADHTLAGLPGVSLDCELANIPLMFIDTVGCGLQETIDEDESKSNIGEAEIVAHHVRDLISMGVASEDIGVVTPYNGQVELITTMIRDGYPHVEIKSVDGFQGREKEAIIISLVRSNGTRSIGFLAEYRRMNVACTRARRHLCIVGDSGTVSSDSTLATLTNYLCENAEFRSANEYDDEVAAPRNMEMIKQQRKSSTKTTHEDKPSKNKPKRDISAQSNETRKAKLLSLLNEFVKDDDRQNHIFSATLNSYERRIIHELATSLGLFHVSTGSVAQRTITVWKKGSPAPIAIGESNNKEELIDRSLSKSNTTDNKINIHDEDSRGQVNQQPNQGTLDNIGTPTKLKENSKILGATPNKFASLVSDDDFQSPNVGNGADVILCKLCMKSIPAANFDIHQVRCEREKRRASVAAQNTNTASSSSKKRGGRGNLPDNNTNPHDPHNLYGRFSRPIAESIAATSTTAFRHASNVRRPQLEQKLKAAVGQKASERKKTDKKSDASQKKNKKKKR